MAIVASNGWAASSRRHCSSSTPMARSTVSTSARWPASGNGPAQDGVVDLRRRRPRAGPGRRAGARAPRARRPCVMPGLVVVEQRVVRVRGLGKARAVAPAQLDVALQVGREAREVAALARLQPGAARGHAGARHLGDELAGDARGPCRSRAGRRARRRPRARRAAPRSASSSPTRSSVKRSWARRPTVARSSPRASPPAGGMHTSWSQARACSRARGRRSRPGVRATRPSDEATR